MSVAHHLVERYASSFPDDFARELESTSPALNAALLSGLPPGTAASVLKALSIPTAADLLREMDPAAASAVLEQGTPTRAAVWLRRIEEEHREGVLAELPERWSEAARRVLAVKPGTVGARMIADALSLPGDLTVSQALEAVRRAPDRVLGRVFVVDRGGRLEGALDAVALLSADPDERLTDCGVRSTARLRRDEPIAGVRRHPAWTRWMALPVVDDRERFLGAIRRDEVLGPAKGRAETVARPLAAALSVAELLWVGLTTMTGGARTAPEKGRRS